MVAALPNIPNQDDIVIEHVDDSIVIGNPGPEIIRHKILICMAYKVFSIASNVLDGIHSSFFPEINYYKKFKEVVTRAYPG